MFHVTSPNEPYPGAGSLAESTALRVQGRFRVSARKLPISRSGEIDAMSARLGIPVPEMIFGDNLVAVTHLPTGWTAAFAAEEALDAVDKTDRGMLRVAYAGDWSRSRERTSAGITEVVRPFDWSYSTTYRGTVGRGLPRTASEREREREREPDRGSGSRPDNTTSTTEDATTEQQQPNGVEDSTPLPQFAPTTRPIPLDLLRRRDPILFADEVVLYESELDDNGISLLTAKFRVMERRMLLLCRLYMRLDGVLVRVRDTRLYVDFETDEVTREYTAREDAFDNVRRNLMRTGLMPDAVIVAMRDANQVADLLPVVEHSLESVKLSPS